MGFFKAGKRRVGIVWELFSFFSAGKRWWMIPILLVLGISGVLIFLAQSSAIAPFLYPLF
jgi:hypothetical protein